jgi:hypothetical protein
VIDMKPSTQAVSRRRRWSRGSVSIVALALAVATVALLAAESGGGTLMKIGKDVNPNSPQFKAAAKACRKLVPGSPFAGGPTPAKP